MAHTPRRSNEKRRHPALFTKDTKIGMHIKNDVATGTVYDVDEGGWIYVRWDKPFWDRELPGYLRSTQIFKIVTGASNV